MKILLANIAPGFEIFSPAIDHRVKSSLYPPLGLLYMGQALEDEGHMVEIIDFLAEKNPIDLLKKSLNQVDAVGIGVYTESLEKSLYVANFVKEFDSSLPVFIGGPHCIYLPEKSLYDIPTADVSVYGEGEVIVNDIIKSFSGTKKLSQIKGIYYRDKNEIRNGKNYSAVKDLDTLSFPARGLVEKYKYGMVNKIQFYKPNFTTILTSRGCPFNCRFCTRQVTSMAKYRARSVENVLKEFEEIMDKYSPIMFLDQNFFGNSKRVNRILDGIINMGSNSDLLIHGARVDSANEALYKKLKKAGVKHIHFGIESGNQDVLNYYNKKTTVDQIRKAVTLSKDMDFTIWGSFILGAPIETKKHFEKTIKFACSLPLDLVVFYPLGLQRGSYLWHEAIKNGNISDDGSFTTTLDSRLGLGNFTSDELRKYCDHAFRRFYFRPSYVLRQIFQSMKNKDYSILRAGFNYI